MIVYRELSSLERDLGIRASTLYAVSNTVERHYHTVSLPKRDGSCRLLSVPDPLLKMIQRRIVRVLLAPMPVSPYAMAYRYGASVVRNAVTMDTSFEDLGADSLDIVEMTMAVAEEFGLEDMDEEDLSGISTVADLVRYLKSKLED